MDPLFYGTVNLKPEEKADLESGNKVIIEKNYMFGIFLLNILMNNAPLYYPMFIMLFKTILIISIGC